MSIPPILSNQACAFPANLFHHAKVHNSIVYTTGQIGGDVSGRLVDTQIKGQAKQTFTNLATILEAAGSTMDRVLSANIYLTEQADYGDFNEVYTELMPYPKPPRTCVFVKALPAGALCEMSLIAAVNEPS
ncbi:hypothetical protein LTR62_003569 [Meristemomyces frigidus]|uniref:YjgF-like protein n=1 Tax=Meristemomyces frigidus TaxID=1508187 RepID=A0AAN7TRQ0_9PEZI|nr:hypothetical protein LTR62_003569 [Meristemomyces frigidus]